MYKNRLLKLLLVIWFFMITALGMAQTASLEIISEKGLTSPFYLYINGIRQNEAPATHMLVNGLPFEVYGLEIRFAEYPNYIKKVIFLRIGKIKSYVLTKNLDTYSLGEGPYTDHPTYTSEMAVLNFKTGSTGEETGKRYLYEDFAKKTAPAVAHDDKEPPRAASQEKYTPRPRLNADSLLKAMKNDEPQPDKPENTCIILLNNDDLRLLKTKMRDEKTIKAKLAVAVTALSNKCISTGQLRELMKSLDGDEMKIELYQQVYRNLTDPQHLSDLYDLFYFENSIEEIRSYK